MVVSVIAYRMPLGGDLLEPIDAGLLQHAADAEKMDQPAGLLRRAHRLDGVLLGRFVQVAFGVVPFGHAAPRVLSAHFQIERHGDQGAVACGQLVAAFIGNYVQRAPKQQTCGRACRSIEEPPPVEIGVDHGESR